MKYELFIICIALAMLPLAQAAVVINPGQSHICEGNETVSCGLCHLEGNESCPECGEIELEEEIYPGDTYKNKGSFYDIEVECLTCEETELTPKTYVFKTLVNKPEGGDIYLSLEIRDFLNTVIGSKTYEPFSAEDVVNIQYRYNFTCPTKVYFENINYDTCAAYFDEYFNDTQPVFFQLATGTSECMKELISCQGNSSASNNMMRDFKDQLEDMISQNSNLREKNANLNRTMIGMDEDYKDRYRDFVPVWWYWLAVLGWFLLGVFLVGNYIFGGTQVG